MLTPAAHIFYATDDHGILLLDTQSATWKTFGPDASRIWMAIVTRGTTDGLADELTIPTNRAPHAVWLGISSLVDAWKRDGLLVDSARTARSRRWRWR
ncbi:hypothetical protein GT043_20400 [Streptomyces sp. SID2131]|nr:hypothetical protein [Streptomyces sp. SID2131]